MKIYFQCLLASLLLFSCVENETPDPQALLDGEVKITVSPIYVGLYNEVWVILHDLDGKPIESQKVVSGQTLTVKLNDSQRYPSRPIGNPKAEITKSNFWRLLRI